MPYKDATSVRLALHYSYEYLRSVHFVASSLRREGVLRYIFTRNSRVVLGTHLCKTCLVYPRINVGIKEVGLSYLYLVTFYIFDWIAILTL